MSKKMITIIDAALMLVSVVLAFFANVLWAFVCGAAFGVALVHLITYLIGSRIQQQQLDIMEKQRQDMFEQYQLLKEEAEVKNITNNS